MKIDSIRAAFIAFVATIVPLTAASADDEAGKAATVPAGKVVKAMPMMPSMPKVNYDGGTAIINFIARVDDETMASLASVAQNAVIGGADTIRINISSQGGSTTASQFAVNVLKNLPVPVETVAMSEIASAAVALYCAGEKRAMADGSTLYLHQQRGFSEIQDKTAAAVVRGHRLSSRWYEDLIHACTEDDSDRSLLDYSSRDVVIDKSQATELGMVTTKMSDLSMKKTWGPVTNVVAPAKSGSFGYPYPSYR